MGIDAVECADSVGGICLVGIDIPHDESIMAKGRKRVRGVPELHDELKKQVNVVLTPTGIEGLDAIAAEMKLSRSELIEQIGRNLIPLAPQGSVPFRERHKLPERAAICLVTKDKQILYIGLSNELKHLNSTELGFNTEEDDVYVAWLECSDSALLPSIKETLIKEFNANLPERVQSSETDSVQKDKARGFFYEQIGNLSKMLAPGGMLMVELPVKPAVTKDTRTNRLLISMTDQGSQIFLEVRQDDKVTNVIEEFSDELKETVRNLVSQLSEHIVPLENSANSSDALERAEENDDSVS